MEQCAGEVQPGSRAYKQEKCISTTTTTTTTTIAAATTTTTTTTTRVSPNS